MRCYICDKLLSEPVYNREIGGHEPCDECLEVIRDAVGSFTDRPSAAEDELDQYELPLETDPRLETGYLSFPYDP